MTLARAHNRDTVPSRTWLSTIKLIKTSTNSATNSNTFYLNTVKIEANTVYGAVNILIKNMLMKIHNCN